MIKKILGLFDGLKTYDPNLLKDGVRNVFKEHGYPDDTMTFQDRAIAEIRRYFPNVEVLNRIQDSGGFGLADLKPEGYEYIERSAMGNGETAEDDAIYRLWSLKHYKDPDHITVSAAFSSIDEAIIEIKLWYKS